MNSTQPPALVIGSGLTVLGVIRCLRRKGIPALVATKDVGFPRGSRYFRAAPRLTTQSLSDYLESLPFEKAVVFPCSDYWAREVANLPDVLKERFPAPIPSLEVLETFLDKGCFAELLQRCELPHPRTILVNDSFDADAFEATEEFFIKPRDSHRFHERFEKKALDFGPKEEMESTLALLKEEGLEVLLQEFVSGPASNHYLFDGYMDRGGVVRTSMLRRRLRIHPPRFGNSSYMVSVPMAELPEAASVVQKAVECAGHRGIFSGEGKVDARSGTFKLLEINVRPWWFIEFAAQCGVDVLEYAYRDALSLPLPVAPPYLEGVYFSYPYYDLRAVLASPLTRGKAIKTWARTCWGSKRPVFRWDDPGPALLGGAQVVGRRLGRLLRRFVR